MSLQTKLQGLIDGKTAVVNSINAKAETDLTVNSKWSDLASAVDGITAGGGGGDADAIIKATITDKGTLAGYYTFYNSKAEDYSFLENVDLSTNTTCEGMFGGKSYSTPCKVVNAPYFDTSNVTTMDKMFQQAQYLKTLPTPFYNTDKVTTMRYFASVSSGRDYGPLQLPADFQLSLPQCKDIYEAFGYRNYITNIKLINTSKITTTESAFRSNHRLTTLDIDTLDAATSNSRMCYECKSLTKLIIRNATKAFPIDFSTFNYCYHFTGTVDATFNPDGLKDAKIYVPDAMVDTFKAATNWATFADIIVPLSTLIE